MKLSVVIPVYNECRTLRQVLQRVLEMPFETEVLCVDDGSTDASAEVARGFGVTVLSTNDRRGPAYARNLGAKSAQGEILFFIDIGMIVAEMNTR